MKVLGIDVDVSHLEGDEKGKVAAVLLYFLSDQSTKLVVTPKGHWIAKITPPNGKR